ncbi:hypothetical protein BDN71DRAFT_773856 [Pleurotus eryngii]|uniref:Secreted protein n=1 Tax=Pleurotus eryngii TaxID=5323 RepID=A0A9P6DHC9_PLEER|nr:hypothetical protein BDN71DRAFT_773856 [Pleurotus eryngii]
MRGHCVLIVWVTAHATCLGYRRIKFQPRRSIVLARELVQYSWATEPIMNLEVSLHTASWRSFYPMKNRRRPVIERRAQFSPILRVAGSIWLKYHVAFINATYLLKTGSMHNMHLARLFLPPYATACFLLPISLDPDVSLTAPYLIH